MASPTVVGTAQWDTGGASPTAHKAQMPAGIQAGDLILVFYVKASATGTGTPDAKWTTTSSTGLAAAYGCAVFSAIAVGTESNALLALTTVAGNRGGSITVVLRGWSLAGGAPFVSSWDQPGTNTAASNPPNVAPGIQSQDEMLIVFAVQNVSGATWTLPANYANRLSDPGTGVGGVSYAIGRRAATVSSEDPASSNWSAAANTPSAITVAVPGTPLVVAPAGAIATITGALTRRTKKALAGAMTPAGAMTSFRKALLAAAGAMTPTGANTRKIQKAYAGAIATITGTLTRRARLSLGGALTPAAELTRKVKLGLAATLNPTATTTTGLKHFLSIGGTLHPSGLLTLARRLFAGPPTLAQVLRGHHTATARLLIIDPTDLETVLHEATGRLKDASVNRDRTRDVPAQGAATLANEGGIYSPVDSSSLIWANRLVRLERGAIIQGRPQYAPLITGIIQKPREATATTTVGFAIASRLQLANRPFPGPLTFAQGTRVQLAVRRILEAGGLGTADAFYDLDDGGATLGAGRTYDDQALMLASAVRLAYDAGCDLYDTGYGIPTMRPWVNPATTEPFWTFQPGIDSTLVDLDRELDEDANAYNRAVAVGTGPDRYPIIAEAKVTNPADPLYWTPQNDRPRRTYTSPDITTQQMALAVAERLLFEGATYTEQIDVVAAENPLIQDRMVVHLVGRNVDDNYLLDSVDHVAGPGQMRLRSRKVRSLIG